jgi:hypothetical protein
MGRIALINDINISSGSQILDASLPPDFGIIIRYLTCPQVNGGSTVKDFT